MLILAGIERSAWRESDQKQRYCRGAGKDNCQAAGKDVIGVHRLAFFVLAISPLSSVNNQMGTLVPDEHYRYRIGAMRVSNKAI